ncbi:(deoxy)nucleoside triphosphate pyrophosphohydrolase [Synoicihabitans lomoniglobus]|uniref:8-oxo-dGTP diphosphatase n=1 Tax=Synoicihabitans lomoniglobus TaxID=2909285 RepID=A0AAE9ZWA1_9BACT|nr:(deoxy)nucleoside triphosphate pyrophosphohydrolase [Opitutaceae bacterium LMO-M01]WED65416.1 (deoxy)nucleoside triphosphate pyrophosphohydrolase [Opitutaceae bacterium LMO-M01]
MTTPIQVCCALIERAGRVLIAQRPPGKHLALQWEFPGGKLEPGEDVATALHREIQEELGCDIKITAALSACEHRYDAVTIVLHPRVAHLTAGSSEPHPHEHVALRWVALAEIAEIDLAAADLPVLAAYRDLRKKASQP